MSDAENRLSLTVYGDESGTHDASPFMLLSGFVAPDDRWPAFDADWRSALGRVGIPYFHATEYWGTRIGEEFAPAIVRYTAEHLLLGYVIRLDKSDYKSQYIAGKRPNKPQLDTMYGVSFRFLISFLITVLPSLLRRSDLLFNIILESGANGSLDAKRIEADIKKQLPTETAMLGHVCFGDKAQYPGLQASDALAFGAYQLELTHQQLSDIPEGATLSHVAQSSLVQPPVFRCALDAATLWSLKSDILSLVEIRKRYAASVKPARATIGVD